ncbi:nucleotidyl transferase AbiEii/AbiGii toxin family protein [Candidatus Woesearchaeota archaeon]|nr:nucleotidyl transferase AbiEii/AbiGii toxin family protein [Candidatus Woesearchaeota archaeon]
MKIPLYNRIKKQAHKDIAAAQDIVMREIYDYFPKAVFHGGTAIWRCYSGNRFSEDLDFYLPSKGSVPVFFQSLERQGFRIFKQRVKENSLYALVEFNRAQVRVEAIFTAKKGAILKEYEQIDGNLMTVYTLSPEELLQEKIAACIKRKKARDLYDVFFLLRLVNSRPKGLAAVTAVQIEDEETLPAIILSGPIPTSQEMKRHITTWEQ